MPLHWYNAVGSNHQSHMGVPWLLHHNHTVPSMYHHAESAVHPFSGRSLGRGREVQAGYGLSDDSAKHQHQGPPILWPGCSVGTSPSGPLNHSGGGHMKVVVLADNGPDWPYAFVHMSDTVLHAPLSDNRHIVTMMDGVYTANARGQLHQLWVWKLLQHGNSVVFPEGLNGEPKAYQFSFQELLLWSTTNVDGTAQDLPMVEVLLSGMESKTTSLRQVPPPFLAIEPPQDMAMVLNLHLQGALEQLQWTSPTASDTTSQHSMPWRKPPSGALGVLPSTSVEDPLSLKRMDSATPKAMTTSLQASVGESTSEHDLNTILDSHSPSLHAALKTPDVASISPDTKILIPPRTSPTSMHDEALWLQRVMNKALEQLLRTRVILTPHHRKLAWDADITRCQNEDQAIKASKRQKSDVQPPLGRKRLQSSRQKPVKRLQSGRLKPIALLKLTIWNYPMRKVCLSWSMKH